MRFCLLVQTGRPEVSELRKQIHGGKGHEEGWATFLLPGVQAQAD